MLSLHLKDWMHEKLYKMHLTIPMEKSYFIRYTGNSKKYEFNFDGQ